MESKVSKGGFSRRKGRWVCLSTPVVGQVAVSVLGVMALLGALGNAGAADRLALWERGCAQLCNGGEPSRTTNLLLFQTLYVRRHYARPILRMPPAPQVQRRCGGACAHDERARHGARPACAADRGQGGGSEGEGCGGCDCDWLGCSYWAGRGASSEADVDETLGKVWPERLACIL